MLHPSVRPCSKGGETEAREEQKLIRGHTAGSRPHCFHLCQGPVCQQGGVAETQLGFCSPRYAPARGLDSPRGKAEGQRSPVDYGNCEPKCPALPSMYHPYTYDSLHVTTIATALCTWTTVRRDLAGQEPRVSLILRELGVAWLSPCAARIGLCMQGREVR